MWRTFKELLSSNILLLRGLILFLIWATNAFVFYGLSLNATSLSGNKYVNFILVCLIGKHMRSYTQHTLDDWERCIRGAFCDNLPHCGLISSEIPGYSLSWWSMNKIGRRWSLGGSLVKFNFKDANKIWKFNFSNAAIVSHCSFCVP